MANVLGVKYLKISKTDANGDDRSEVLRQLTNIRLKYSDIGVKQYNIQTTQELSTYFLFGINYQDIASPNDKGIYDYQTQAIQVGGYLVDSTDGVVPVQGYNSTIANSRFDISTGTLRLGTKSTEHNPNAVIQITASVDYASSAGTPTPILSIVEDETQTALISISSASITTPGTLVLTASITDQSPLWNQLVNLRGGLQLGLQNEQPLTQVQFYNISLTITQSQAFTNTSSILTVPSPNNIKKFESTDCDVTYGFVDQYPISQYYMDADYSSGITIPINQQQLVSGTAVLAPVKDYYYYLQSQTNPRYQGSRVSQLELNKYTGPTSTYIGDTGYGKSPNVELNRAYFAWFTEVYGASPEYNDAVNVNIKYLVDELGNTYTPGLTRYFEDELIGTFTQGEAAELNFVDAVGGTNSTPTAIKTALNGERAIIRPGVKASAVLYSQTGSSVGAYTQSLQFTTIEDGSAYKNLTDYRFGVQQYGQQTISAGSGYTQVTFTTENWDFANGYNTGTSRYTFSSTPQSKIRFKITLGEIFTNSSENYKIVLKKNGTTDIYSYSVTGGGGSTTSAFTIITDYYNFQSGDYLEVLVQQVSNVPIILARNGTKVEWLAEQQQLTQQTLPSITAPFFFTSSTDPYILTASLQFSSSINQVYQVGLSGSGFDPIRYKVSFEPGDQFRFENNELNVYTINKIISSSTAQGSNGQTVLLLDQPITNGTNVNYFLLRRFAPDPGNVIIEGIKPSGGTGAGTLKPTYITDNLNNNMANIVSKLNSENAI